MKYTINQAAKMVGATRQTIYRHIESKPISTEKDDNGNQLIDAAELIRVYGDKVNFEGGKVKSDKDVTPAKIANVTKSDNDNLARDIEDKIRIAKLESEIYSMTEIMRKTEEENAYIKLLLEDEKTERKKAINLLEDLRQKETKGDEWKSSIRALEQRLANQEKAAKEREEKEQKLLDENKRIKQAYMKQKQALEAEQNKSFWKKLFG